MSDDAKTATGSAPAAPTTADVSDDDLTRIWTRILKDGTAPTRDLLALCRALTAARASLADARRDTTPVEVKAIDDLIESYERACRHVNEQECAGRWAERATVKERAILRNEIRTRLLAAARAAVPPEERSDLQPESENDFNAAEDKT